MACTGCGRGFHYECNQQPCCCTDELGNIPFTSEELPPPVGRKQKPDDELSTSGGRKRAAAKYEINSDEACEWRGLTNCGGGKYPIVGCLDGKQQNRHHGPDKKTSNNDDDNVHLICAQCHNRWHAKNDDSYIRDEYRVLKHEPRPATLEELMFRDAS